MLHLGSAKFKSIRPANRSTRTKSHQFRAKRAYSITSEPRDVDECDVLIVGGGPAGLSAAIRVKQLANERNKDFRVCVLEKGGEVGMANCTQFETLILSGGHIMSGACIETRAFDELIPDWKELGAPITTKVTAESTYMLTKNYKIPLPIPPAMHNEGNYIVSLGNVTRWLGQQAEALGVEVYSGFPGSELIYDETGKHLKGVATGDVGIGRDGKPTDQFQRGLELHAPFTLLAEGCRGSLTKQAMKRFNLNKNAQPQTYGLGIKEVWEVQPEKFKLGTVVHTLGWPMDMKTWAGSFIYHWENNMVALGYVVGLDYENPWLSPYQEFQRLKHHPLFADLLKDGKPLSYGARALNEGGLQALPELVFPGGALLGCAAGTLNVPKIKGTHTAMKSGMLAAEAVVNALESGTRPEGAVLNEYKQLFNDSWVHEELHRVRNFKPSFNRGTWVGMVYSGLDMFLFRGKEPWTLSHHATGDHTFTKPAKDMPKIEYPKPDGVLSFDLLTNLSRSGTNHNENQPGHLKLTDPEIPQHVNWPVYQGLENRFCPAGVYEYVDDPTTITGKRLVINAQNCLHCKTCDIKDPMQNITFTTPEGGGGPSYGSM